MDVIEKIQELVDLKHKLHKFKEKGSTNTQKVFKLKHRYKKLKQELEKETGQEFYSHDKTGNSRKKRFEHAQR